MQIGMVGLGRIGANIARQLMQAGHSAVVWDANPATVEAPGKEGAVAASGLPDLVEPDLVKQLAMRFGFGGHVEPGRP